jgi:hypothetical protein
LLAIFGQESLITSLKKPVLNCLKARRVRFETLHLIRFLSRSHALRHCH